MLSSLRKQGLLVVICLLLQAAAFAGYNDTEEPDDIFSYQDIRIEAHQIIEHLLVSGADAVVLGSVKEEIIILDGNARIEPGAWVEGRIIVLGGQVMIGEGSYVANTPWVTAPVAHFSFTKTVLVSIVLLAALGLIALPYCIWALLHLLRDVPLYLRFKEWLQALQQRWPALYIIAALAFSALMLVAFSELTRQTIFRQTMGLFDNSFIWFVRYFASPNLDPYMIFVTNLGYGYTYAAILVASVLLLAFSRRWHEFKALLICLLGSTLLNNILKFAFQRTRPEAFRIVDAAGYSFPSGHAMVSLCLYGMLAFLIARNIRSRHGQIAVAVAAVLLIGAIGISRIYLGVHYPSDVVAGYTAGATWLAFSISLLMWWQHKN